MDKRIASIKAIGPQSGEARLLVLAALLLADELHDRTAGAATAAAPPAQARPAAPLTARLVAARASTPRRLPTGMERA